MRTADDDGEPPTRAAADEDAPGAAAAISPPGRAAADAADGGGLPSGADGLPPSRVAADEDAPGAASEIPPPGRAGGAAGALPPGAAGLLFPECCSAEDVCLFPRRLPTRAQVAELVKELAKDAEQSDLNDEPMLCRFLMARDNDLAAAAKMCRESFAFRKLHVPRALNECGSFTVESDAPLDGAALEGRWSWRCFESPADASSLRARLALMHAPDKLMPTITAADGSPVFISRFGALDVDGIATESLADPLVMRIVAHLEDCLQTCRSRGRAQHRIVRARAVLDLAGLRVFAAIRRLRLLKQIFSIGQAIYPEGIHSVTIINAPRAFATFWSVFSLILDDAMRAKILIVGTDYAAALKDHANIVVTAQLPKSMGGQAENDMLPLTLPVEKGVGQTLRDANEPPFLVEAFEP